MTDSGLMSHVIGVIHSDDILSRPVRSQNEGGKLVETWIYNQLMPEMDLHPLWKIYHLRTKAHEIDFLIENDKQAYLGIEVKSGESVNSRDFKDLKWFGSQIDRPFRGIVLYAGEKVRSFGDNCYAIPMASLWNAS